MYRRILLLGSILFSLSVQAQLELTKTPVSDTLKADLTKYIPPLYMLIDSAIENHPEIKRWAYESESFEHEIKNVKWDKLNAGVGTNWNAIINPYPQFTIDDDLTPIFDPVPDGNFVGFPSTIYGRIELSFDKWATQKNRKKMLKAQANADAQGSEYAKRQVAAEVTMLYNNLFMYQRMLEINQKAIQMGKMGVELGEEKFRNGQIQLSELSQLYDLMTKYGLEYERSYAAYKSAYTDLERLVGVPLSKFKF